ncbi:hypothetical protein [Clostridium manihotivorum]|uniref:Restriction endonuclease type IV Mrr domain-containing protein n=1 Tax=Clostridium manihotivorum TaxID=2320868 RepID=A0A3R5QWX5_9CLOT|nr:hypothetical protein [Clostridium manihotivorum]QAA34125.1 hypothetical protein C1I91_22220 [Clostridium manihotivorum]
MFTITGIIVILSMYQLFKVGRTLIRIVNIIKKDFKINTLGEELDRLSSEEFIDWCVEYLKTKNYIFINKFDTNTLLCKHRGEKVYVSCVKSGEFDKINMYKLIGIKASKKIDKIAVLANIDEAKLDDEILKEFNSLGIEIISGGEFNVSYEEYVKMNSLIR